MKNPIFLKDSPLGKETDYPTQYDPSLIFSIPRSLGRATFGLTTPLPFFGTDFWRGYELSWLDKKGKPQVAFIDIEISCLSENLFESKSLKLYLNSFNQTSFSSPQEVKDTITRDLLKSVQGDVKVKMILPSQFSEEKVTDFKGIYLDDLDITTNVYEPEPSFLTVKPGMIEETLCSHLLKSNCPMTGQPDWATILIRYKGKPIDHEGLLKYIISYRNHSGFHEQCVEKTFCDIMDRCQPTNLTVYARYTRRGGLDINPYRSNFEPAPAPIRLGRQ